MSCIEHYLAPIQSARRTLEALVPIQDQLPGSVVARTIRDAESRLDRGLCLLAANPDSMLHGNPLAFDMARRARLALNHLYTH